MPFEPITWQLRTRTLDTKDHTLIMGILNVTPDSFSDGGRWATTEAAVERGRRLAESGADIVDVGGESTRPGAAPVEVSQEIDRVAPVIEALSGDGIVVSVDTAKPEVAAAAIDAGAEIVNDITGLADPEMIPLCAATGVGVVIMHMQGTPETMQDDPGYDDVVIEVAGFLAERSQAAVDGGIDAAAIVVDPGIGFGKTATHNLQLLASLDEVALARPMLIGTSRKTFLGSILEKAGRPSRPTDRDVATAASLSLAISSGAAVVRVHDVEVALEASRTADAIVRAQR
ncbi:MAG: dihydropteroate synthase [Acidimicrobiia bacterium]|nr:MAG: dihydropteroate synthase [Acidimicrobiia bacterium]